MRTWLRKILQVRDTPEAQARGLAIGVFFGISPLFGLQTLLAIALSHLTQGNKVLAVAGTAVSNPITSLPLYGACYAVGRTLLGGTSPLPDWSTLTSTSALIALGPRFLLELAVGSMLVAGLGGLATYLLSSRLLGLLGRWSRRSAEQPAEG
ncbi:MAG: DUF2062 domain-containing protein [Myxococcales bacterium]